MGRSNAAIRRRQLRVWGQRIPATPFGNSMVSDPNSREVYSSRSAKPPQTAPPIPRRSRFVQAMKNPGCEKNAECGMRNWESIQFVFLPHSEFRIPNSAFRIPHSEFRKPVAWATNAITEGRARFRIGTQWFSRSGCWNRRAGAALRSWQAGAVQSSVTSNRVTDAGASTQCSSGPRRSVGVELGTTVSGCSKVL